MKLDNFVRVSAARKCPVCSKPDWCLVAKDGTAAICPRVASDTDVGEAGYLHHLSERIPMGRVTLTKKVERKPDIDWHTMQRGLQNAVRHERLEAMAASLGVSAMAVAAMDVGFSLHHHAWTFPMRDGEDRVVGVRVRNDRGEKWAISGSTNGLFYPNLTLCDRVYVVEGPTDCAAMLDMDLPPIGLPSCSAGAEFLCDFLKRNPPLHVVMIVENDKPDRLGVRAGLRGFTRIANKIHRHARSLKLIHPDLGAKDARDWMQRGATRERIEFIAKQTQEFQPVNE